MDGFLMIYNYLGKDCFFVVILTFPSLLFPSVALPPLPSFHIQNIYKGLVAYKEDIENMAPNFSSAYKYANKVNFAGHYVLFTFGSGGGSLGYGLFDAISGKLVASEIPNCYADEFTIDSSLLIIKGKALDDEEQTVKYFVITDGELKLLRTTAIVPSSQRLKY
jgi:hypothetical protein